MLINDSRYGLIVSGTKRGKQVFFTLNLQGKDEEVNEKIADLRSYFSQRQSGHEFYAMEYKSSVTYFQLVHTLTDALGRPGYLCISVVVPLNKEIVPTRLVTLLQNLLRLYKEKYVQSENGREYILTNVREDRTQFQGLLDAEPPLETDPLFPLPVASRKGACFLAFNSPEELETIFEFAHRDELNAYNYVVVLHASILPLFEEVQVTTPLPPVRKMHVTVQAETGSSQRPLNDVELEVTGSRSGARKLVCSPQASFIAWENEELIITASKPNYIPATVSPLRLRNAIADNRRRPFVTIHLDEKEPPKPRIEVSAPNAGNGMTKQNATQDFKQYSQGYNRDPRQDLEQKRLIAALVVIGVVIIGFGVYVVSELIPPEQQTNPIQYDTTDKNNTLLPDRNDSVSKKAISDYINANKNKQSTSALEVWLSVEKKNHPALVDFIDSTINAIKIKGKVGLGLTVQEIDIVAATKTLKKRLLEYYKPSLSKRQSQRNYNTWQTRLSKEWDTVSTSLRTPELQKIYESLLKIPNKLPAEKPEPAPIPINKDKVDKDKEGKGKEEKGKDKVELKPAVDYIAEFDRKLNGGKNKRGAKEYLQSILNNPKVPRIEQNKLIQHAAARGITL